MASQYFGNRPGAPDGSYDTDPEPGPSGYQEPDDEPGDDERGPRGGQRGGRQGGGYGQYAPRQFRSTSRALIAEFILAMVLVVIKPTEPAADSSNPKGASESVVPQLVSVMLVFLLLSALGTAGPRPQRWANLFGGLVVLVLGVKNHGNITASVKNVTTYKTAAVTTGSPSATASSSGTSGVTAV